MNALEYQAMELNFRQQTIGKHQRLQNQGIYDPIQALARQADHKMIDTLKEETITWHYAKLDDKDSDYCNHSENRAEE